MKRLFVLLLCMFLLILPVKAMASTGPELGDYIGPDSGIGLTLLVVTLAIVLDTGLGIFLAIKRKEFDLRLLPQFLGTGVVPYIGGLLLLAVLAFYVKEPFAGMFYFAAAAIAGKYSKDVWNKLKLFSGD